MGQPLRCVGGRAWRTRYRGHPPANVATMPVGRHAVIRLGGEDDVACQNDGIAWCGCGRAGCAVNLVVVSAKPATSATYWTCVSPEFFKSPSYPWDSGGPSADEVTSLLLLSYPFPSTEKPNRQTATSYRDRGDGRESSTSAHAPFSAQRNSSSHAAVGAAPPPIFDHTGPAKHASALAVQRITVPRTPMVGGAVSAASAGSQGVLGGAGGGQAWTKWWVWQHLGESGSGPSGSGTSAGRAGVQAWRSSGPGPFLPGARDTVISTQCPGGRCQAGGARRPDCDRAPRLGGRPQSPWAWAATSRAGACSRQQAGLHEGISHITRGSNTAEHPEGSAAHRSSNVYVTS